MNDGYLDKLLHLMQKYIAEVDGADTYSYDHNVITDSFSRFPIRQKNEELGFNSEKIYIGQSEFGEGSQWVSTISFRITSDSIERILKLLSTFIGTQLLGGLKKPLRLFWIIPWCKVKFNSYTLNILINE